MRSLVLLIAVALAPSLNAQERFLYGALPANNQPGPSPFYFDNGNTYQQPFGNNRFPSTPDISSPSYDYSSQKPYASGNFPQSNGFTSFQQTLGLNPFDFQQQTVNTGYQQSIRPFEEFGRFEGSQPFSPYVSPFSGFPQNNQEFGMNQSPVAPPQFLFPTANNQQFGPSPFRNIPSQLPAQQPQFPAQQPQFPVQQPQFPVQQPQFQTQQPQFPVQQPQFPVQQPQFPAQQPQFPAQQPQFPVQQPQFPVQQPQFPVKQPQFLTQQPQQSFQNTNPFQQSQFPANNLFQQPQTQQGFPTTTGTESTQPTQSGQPPSPPSQGNQLRPIKGIFGPGQPGQFDAPKEYVIPL